MDLYIFSVVLRMYCSTFGWKMDLYIFVTHNPGTVWDWMHFVDLWYFLGVLFRVTLLRILGVNFSACLEVGLHACMIGGALVM